MLLLIDSRCGLAIDPAQVCSMRIHGGFGHKHLLISMQSGEGHVIDSQKSGNVDQFLDVDAVHERILTATQPSAPIVLKLGADTSELAEQLAEQLAEMLRKQPAHLVPPPRPPINR